MRIPISLAVLALLLLIGCRRSSAPQTPLAQVDNETLTLEDVRSRLDTTSLTQAQLQEYVQRWIMNELLYREAIRRGVNNSETLRNRLADIQRQMTINALLDELVYRAESVQATPQEISTYFDAHKAEFNLPTDVALVSFALFRNREAATLFRTTVLRGTPWADAIRQTATDPEKKTALVTYVDSVYFTQATFLPVELWRVATTFQRGEPSFPIRTEDGFYCLVVWKLLRQGQTPDLAYVEREIRSRLAIERRRTTLDSLMENLRSRHIVQVFMATGVPDTARIFE
ncbi:MAG TPA: peptidylprolyl isomerase [Bacteroidota bacterium]|nr:peptidylprolyl isomerase [Bacteroidota bacterium]